MGLHIHCPTSVAILLVSCRNDENPVMRFPSGKQQPPGLFVHVKPLQPIHDQLVACLRQFLNSDQPLANLDVEQDFAGQITLEKGINATLYVARLADIKHPDLASWPTMPELLRAMPKDRSRLPYLLAWQALSSGVNNQIKAVEVDEIPL